MNAPSIRLSPNRPLFGQASSLAVAISLERLAWAEVGLANRLQSYANRHRLGEMAVVADLAALTQLRLIYLLRPAIVAGLRPYHSRRHGRTDPVAPKRLAAIRGWKRKYPNLLRKD